MSKNSGKKPSDNRTGNNEQNETSKDLPGYPHYPANEDILNPDSGFRKTSSDVEELANSRRLSGLSAGRSQQSDTPEGGNDNDDDDIRIVPGTEADVTREDLILLGDKDADQDLGDDELVHGNARVDDRDLQNDKLQEDDLDIPGAEDDDKNEELGEEDEENNYYSLGGDNKEGNEEDQA